ncbi:hypothetical protein KG892_05115 [Vermiphilus pyriformis]|nr:MAG: hypothetical protein KG892_05115 [Vermiphilus pyriformis]
MNTKKLVISLSLIAVSLSQLNAEDGALKGALFGGLLGTAIGGAAGGGRGAGIGAAVGIGTGLIAGSASDSQNRRYNNQGYEYNQNPGYYQEESYSSAPVYYQTQEDPEVINQRYAAYSQKGISGRNVVRTRNDRSSRRQIIEQRRASRNQWR